MQRKRAIGIGVIIALLMVTSTFTTGILATEPLDDPGHAPGLSVSKKVWDGECWVDEIEADGGDIVRFNITIAYYQYDPVLGYKATHINVTDILPDCLEYADNATFEPSAIAEQTIYWNLTEDYGIELWDDPANGSRTVSIEFDAVVVSYGENVNCVYVSAKEKCSDEELYDEDCATVVVEENIELEKKVKSLTNDSWMDHLDWVDIDDVVQFQITLTYHGEYRMPCLVIADYLPEGCLEYIETVKVEVNGELLTPGTPEYPDVVPDASDTIKICGEDVDISEIEDWPCLGGTIIIWDFRLAEGFELLDGDSVVIEFIVNVTSYCSPCEECDDISENYVAALLWGCAFCDCDNYFFDWDCAYVVCQPRPSEFEKLVWNGQTWVDKATFSLGSEVHFRLSFTYYGQPGDFLIKVVDELPDCLEYINNSADPDPTFVSQDNRTVWWNFTSPVVQLEPEVPFVIEFDALVVDMSYCCQCENWAELRLKMCGCQGWIDFEDNATIMIMENTPPLVALQGETSGEVGENLDFQVIAQDMQGDPVKFKFNWGDETTGWMGNYDSGIWQDFDHSWDTAGTYNVKAKAKDTHDEESGWSNIITVVISGEGEEPEVPDENISIGDISGGLGVKAIIKNIGAQNAEVNWTIEIEGVLLGLLDKTTEGTDEIDAGDEVEVKGQAKIFGIGRVEIKVTADAGTYGNDHKTVQGFVIGPLVRIS